MKTTANLLAATGILLGSILSLPAFNLAIWPGPDASQWAPTLNLTNVVGISAGDGFTMALRSDGMVVSTSWSGPLGGTNFIKIASGWCDSLGVRADGTVTEWNLEPGLCSSFGPGTMPGDLTNIVSAASGYEHSIVLKSDGTCVSWGWMTVGPGYVPAGLSNVVAIAAGFDISGALKSDGSVTAWGYSGYGGTAAPGGLTDGVAIAMGHHHGLVLRSNGVVVAWGTTAPPGLTNVLKIAAKQTWSMVLKADGMLVAWNDGVGSQHQVPNQRLTNVLDIAAGCYHGAVLVGDGPPQPLWVLSGVTNLAEGTVSFTGEALGTEPLFYQWLFNGTNLPGANTPTLTLTNIQPAQAGAYSVVVSNAYGVVTNSGASLSVLPFIISAQPTNLTAYGGDSATNCVTAQGAGLQYQWLLNETAIPGKTNAILTFTAVTTNDAGNYSVVVSNSYGSVESSNATLVVTPLAIVLQPADQSGYVGDSVVFTVAAQKNGPFTYQWRFGGTDLTGQTNVTLSLTNLTTAQNGNYTVFVSNPYGSLESSNAALTVLDSAPIILSQPANQITWPGGAATFQISANGSKPLSYQWRFKGTNVIGATNATFSLAGVATNQMGNYSVIVSNAVGSTPSSSATLTFIPVASWGDTNNGLATLPASLTNVIAIAAGYDHDLALKPDGTVVAWGNISPFLPFFTDVMAIAAGYQQSWGLKTNGTVLAWGNSISSSSAVASNVVAISAHYNPNSYGWNSLLALKSDGTVIDLVSYVYSGTIYTRAVPDLNGTVGIAAGVYHMLGLKPDGTVKAVLDYSDYNANRVPTNLNNVVQIAAGLRHSLALKSDGTVAAWGVNWYGVNTYGVTNVPLGLSNVVNIAAGDYHNIAMKSDGTIVSWGWNNYGQTNVPTGLSNVVSVAGGGYHSLALIGSTKPAIVRQPKSAFGLPLQPVLLSVGVVSPGSLSYLWQFNGQNITDATNPVYRISSLVRANQGSYRVLVSDATQVITSAVAQVTMSGNIVIAWGDNFYGQTNVPPGLNAMAIAGGGDCYSLALRPDGSVVAWGYNGLHETNVPVTATNVTAIAAGDDYNLVLRSNGTVVAWGDNASGQCNVPAGLNNAVSIAAGYNSSLALKSDGNITQWGGWVPLAPTSLSNVVAIACGNTHALVLKSDGTVVAWGNNSYGQCNVPASLTNVVSIAVKANLSLALGANGTVMAWGWNSYGQTNVPAGLSNVVAVVTSGYHSLALKSDGTVAAWGDNYSGQTNTPAGLGNVVGIAAGGSHSMLLVGSADPAIVRQPAPVYASVFGHVLLSVGAAGSQPLSYQWRTNGVPIPGATNSWLDLPAALPANSGIYSVVVSNTLGVAVSSNSIVNVIVRSPFIVTQPIGQTNIGGATATFQAAAGGSLPFNYQWQKDAAGLLDGINPALTLNNLTRSNSGAYSVIISNAFGFVTSSNAMLRVMVPQQLQAPVLNPDGSLSFVFSDSDGGLLASNDVAHFAVSVSTNLVDWQVLPNTPLLTNGMLWLQDFDATNLPQRFYRVIENP